MKQGLIIGITGSIGSGKSVVSRILRCNGFMVYDCDSRARWLMENDEKVRHSLKLKFGEQIYNEKGLLDRKLMAALIFGDKDTRNYVNSVVHEAVRNDIMKIRREIDGDLFIESAILATGGISPFCDKIWIVTAPENLRVKRIEARDNLNRKEILDRMEVQKKELNSLKKESSIVLENDDTHQLLSKVLYLINCYNNPEILKFNYIKDHA